MDSGEYKQARVKRGKIADVARALKVSPQSIWNRENGKTPISKEAELALVSLHIIDTPSFKQKVKNLAEDLRAETNG